MFLNKKNLALFLKFCYLQYKMKLYRVVKHKGKKLSDIVPRDF